MLKKATGNMYPWVTHTKSYLTGECPHRCSYCYVQAMAKRFPNVRTRYSGPLAMDEAELQEPLGSGRTVFIEHMNDLFANDVPSKWIDRILHHCSSFQNRYVFQSKNPGRFQYFIPQMYPDTILGTTIESNRHYPHITGDAPHPKHRYAAMLCLPRFFKIFITIEPILDFDELELVRWLAALRPDWVNIGADSKAHGLPEPSKTKVLSLIQALVMAGIKIERKTNLDRLLK